MLNDTLPTTLLQATEYFSDEQVCFEYVKSLRWPDGVVKCVHCDSTHVKLLTGKHVWKCYACKKRFSVRLGTIFTDSALPLKKWLIGFWLVMNAKNGISSYEIHRSLGVTQKTAWFMAHRIREVMRTGSVEKLSGAVESDSTYIGGLDRNRHKNKRKDAPGGGGKAIVFGVVERGGKVRSKVADSTGVQDSENDVLTHVSIGSRLFTDEAPGYRNMGIVYEHATVNHSKGQYVVGGAHTNTIEGYWNLFKRCYKGTYIHMAPFHIDRYLDEQGLRYNLRKGDDGSRFQTVTSQVVGRHLPYKELTGKAAA